MRNTPHLHERHLLEAIRQKVISEDQYEGIVAIARSNERAEGGALPDLGWLSAMQGVAAAFAVGVPGLYLLTQLQQDTPAEVASWSALGFVVSLASGVALRRSRSSAIAASVLLAAAAAFAWGIAAGLLAQVMHTDFFTRGWSSTMLAADSHARIDTLLAGDIAVIAVAALLVLRFEVAMAAAPATFAALHLFVEAAHRFVVPYDVAFGERQAAPWIAAAGLTAMIAARWMDKHPRGRIDPAFWIHTVGLLGLGFALTSRIDRDGEGLFWSIAALVVIAAGVRWNRRIYLVLGSVAWMFWPAMTLSIGPRGATAMIGGFVFSAVTLVAMATYLRRNWNKYAPASDVVRSVWV